MSAFREYYRKHCEKDQKPALVETRKRSQSASLSSVLLKLQESPDTDKLIQDLNPIVDEVKMYLTQQRDEMKGLGPESPQVAYLDSILGIIAQNIPQIGEDLTKEMLREKIMLLAKELELKAEDDTSHGTFTDYLRKLTSGLNDFATRIDFGDDEPVLDEPEEGEPEDLGPPPEDEPGDEGPPPNEEEEEEEELNDTEEIANDLGIR